jgi:tetratricopeptide (TPR) repeat protein
MTALFYGSGDGLGVENDLFQRSIAALAGGNPERAKQQLLKLLEKDRNNLELLTFLTSIYQQYQQPQHALLTAQRSARLDPVNPQHWNNLGYLHIVLGQWKQAEECYAKAAQFNDASPTIYLHHALTLLELEQTEKALAQLKVALNHSLSGELLSIIQTDSLFTKIRPLLNKL